MDDFLFGQHTAGTAPWFVKLYGQAHSVPLRDFPHTRGLVGDHDIYLEYLRYSWSHYGLDNTEETRRDQLDRLLKTNPAPISVVRRPDGKLLIVDGNHRAAAYYAAGAKPSIEEVSADAWLAKTTANRKERYGSKPGKPYQSVFFDGKEWVKGRRRDTLTRHETIGASDVLDLGCNIGASTLLAGGHGVDSSPGLVTSAWRLAAFFASPATFQVADLNGQSFQADTVFCFAVVAHLKKLDALRETLRRARVVFFEENTGPPQFGKVKDLFTSVEKLPGERTLYRCITS